MSDVTRILSQIESGDPSAAEQLLPLVYDELRKLASAKLAHEKPGQTLQATALVREAFRRHRRTVTRREREKWVRILMGDNRCANARPAGIFVPLGLRCLGRC